MKKVEKDCLAKMPIVDYDQLAGKIKERKEALAYWPADTAAEQLMRMAYSTMYIGAYDNKCQMATDIRTACTQFMAEIDDNQAGINPVTTLADKLRVIHEKYWKIARCGGRYKG